MTSFLDSLLRAPADKVLFSTAKGAAITAGQVRAAAAALAARHAANRGRLFVFSRSLTGLAAAILVAAVTRRALVILPQDTPAYRASVGADDASFLGDCVPEHTAEDASLEIADAPLEFVFFTSGSSGAAKEIPKTLALLETEAQYWLGLIGDRIDQVSGTVSHQHIYGMIFRLILPVLCGVASRDETALSWEALLEHVGRRTLLVSGPAHLTRLPPHPVGTESRPVLILSSGGPLPEDAAKQTETVLGTLPLEIFGSTETGGIARRQRTHTDTPWTPLDGMRFDVSPEGETILYSPFIQAGTAQKLDDHLSFNEDGTFQMIARTDRIVKIEGKRVSLARVETVLRSHPDIDDAVVLVTQSGGRDRLSALIVLKPGGSLKLGEFSAFRMGKNLFAALRDLLEPAEIPKRWRFVAAIPVNSQSKRVLSNLVDCFESPALLEMLAPERIAIDGFAAEMTFMAEPGLPWFDGHFPGLPIMPGLAQVHIAVRLAEDIWGIGPASMRVSRMKFHRIIQPNERISLSFSVDPDKRQIQFSFKCENVLVSTGTVG